MDRVFLDANVLYSAAWRPTLTGLRLLWTLDGVTLMSSSYAVDEAARNIREPFHRARLSQLVQAVTVVDEDNRKRLPASIQLPAKDRPILLAAISHRATHLLTGDRTHFGRYFDQIVEGVLICLPATYIERRRPR